MSAKLLKSLASGSCRVTNTSGSEVLVYWKSDKGVTKHLVIGSGVPVDLLNSATVSQLRKSPNLKYLFNRGYLKISAS